MSVTGAAKVGTTLSGIVIKFQKAIYDAKISQLQGYAGQLDTHLQALEGYKSQIPHFWLDKTGEQYARDLDEQIMQLKTARQRITDLSTLYENIKEGLTESQEQVSSAVDTITAAIGSLTGQV